LKNVTRKGSEVISYVVKRQQFVDYKFRRRGIACSDNSHSGVQARVESMEAVYNPPKGEIRALPT